MYPAQLEANKEKHLAVLRQLLQIKPYTQAEILNIEQRIVEGEYRLMIALATNYARQRDKELAEYWLDKAMICSDHKVVISACLTRTMWLVESDPLFPFVEIEAKRYLYRAYVLGSRRAALEMSYLTYKGLLTTDNDEVRFTRVLEWAINAQKPVKRFILQCVPAKWLPTFIQRKVLQPLTRLEWSEKHLSQCKQEVLSHA